jgi:hypothetical protein
MTSIPKPVAEAMNLKNGDSIIWPYESGYDYGCDDADISDSDDRYINQPENGPSFHTDEFMSGYNDGYDECSNGGNSDGSGISDEPDRNFGRDNDGKSDGSGRINCDANPADAFCNSEKREMDCHFVT